MEPRWYALYTKSRHEKCIHFELAKRNVESFLPLRKIKRRWSDRTVTIEEPLFKSYLFVRTGFPRIKDVLNLKGAVGFVKAGTEPIPIHERVIQSLKNLVQSEVAIDPFPYLETGDRVRVRSGLFKDIEGVIVRKDNRKCRIVISIDALMASVSVEVDSCLVEKA